MKKTIKPNLLPIVLTALLSGLVWYRIGVFVSCSSQWLRLEKSELHSGATGVYHPQTQRTVVNAQGVDNADATSVPSSARHASSSSPRRHSNRYDGPAHKCGVVFFYHIPSTGGSSINSWLRKYANTKHGYGYKYFQHWEADFKGSTEKNITQVVERTESRFTQGMNNHIQNLGENEWRIAHCHINSMYINETESLLYEWRKTIEEEQGCKMINTVMLRDPLSHTISLHKVIARKNSTKDGWIQFLNSPTERGLWATNLDFVLYNKGRRNPYNVTKEEKVRRAMELLDNHFDVVTVGNHGLFSELVLNMTGWKYIEMPRTNTFKGELVFTKKDVEKLQKLLAANGDVEFMDAVRRRYHGYLSYLDNI